MSDRLTIRCRENGPLVLPPEFTIVDHRGQPIPLPVGKELIALCRCGASEKKPFCDGRHKQIGFQGDTLAHNCGTTPSINESNE